MRTYLDCYPCFLRQALEASRMNGADEQAQWRVLRQVLPILETADFAATPPEIAHRVHQTVRDILQVEDPYRLCKEESTRQALELYEHLRSMVDGAPDPLEASVRLAIAGNAIDYGAPNSRPATTAALREAAKVALQLPLTIDHLGHLRDRLASSERVLYLADNAGETVFDRVLIETMARPTTYVVKDAPILNDAVMADALDAGLDRVARVMSSGSNAPGTILALCSPEMRTEFDAATLIVAKGQANFETLSDVDREVFFLLQVKCPVIGQHLGVPVGSRIVKCTTCRSGSAYGVP